MREPRRSRRIAFGAIACLLGLGLVAAACGDDDSDSADSGSDAKATKVVVADQGFGESKVLAQIYGQLLADNGYDVSYQSLKDRAATYAAFASGDIDLVPEYAASGLEFLNGNAGEASGDVTATVEKLNAQLAQKDLVAAEPSDAVDTNSLVVTKETADKGITSISDLTEDMKLGGPQDCPTNASCIPALQASYGLDMSKNFVPLDTGGPNTKAALQNGDIDVAILFSTDSTIAVNGWKVLTDEEGIFNADNIIPVLTKELAADTELIDLLNQASAALTTEKLTDLNRRYDVDKDDAEDIAADFLKGEGLQ
jgi:osmoprotectant transport system substrate-binding protein